LSETTRAVHARRKPWFVGTITRSVGLAGPAAFAGLSRTGRARRGDQWRDVGIDVQVCAENRFGLSERVELAPQIAAPDGDAEVDLLKLLVRAAVDERIGRDRRAP
jgi:hypothetical protein